GAVTGNPAGLAFLDGSAVLVDVLPPVGASLGDFVDIEERVADEVDAALEEYEDGTLEPVYPELSVDLGQPGGVVSGALALHTGRLVFGAAIEEPMEIGLDLVNTGLEALGHTVKDDGEGDVDIDMRLTADAAVDLSLRIDRTTIGGGYRVSDELSAGASLSLYRSEGAVSGVLIGGGIINYGGTEYAFNDPNDPWSNDLDQTVSGSYEGDGVGWSVGASWRPSPGLTLDAAYVAAPAITMAGEVVTVSNLPPAFEDGELDPDGISASQPTYTESETEIENASATVEFPSYFGGAVSFRLGPALTTLEYRRYTGALAVRFDGSYEALEATDGLGLEIDLGAARIGAGVLRGILIHEDGDERDEEDILVPLANLGFGVGIVDGMRIETTALAVPLQAFRTSLVYEF
ncbi:MAG: hypothetical protein GF405_09475, partial [Candidatus Eisenbacteria bacterium]|nr:hypothetical protein [Candidatus Eisenbacteria bacterium]